MAKRRSNGEGNIRKRKDGRWEGGYTAGINPETGKQIFKNVLGKTQAEVKEKLKKVLADSQRLDLAKQGKYTVGTWMIHGLRMWRRLRSGHHRIRPTEGILTTTSSLMLAKFH